MAHFDDRALVQIMNLQKGWPAFPKQNIISVILALTFELIGIL